MERVAVLGAGISGLSCALLLREQDYDVTVLEATDRVGGLARSFRWHGFDCDIAPHRFFTSDDRVRKRIQELVPMVHHRRRSRIFIAGRKVHDPVNPIELVLRLPPRISSRLVFGYLFKPNLSADSFENLALNRFGRGLYEHFFKPYTQKMFGVPPSEISVEWARQKLRVSGLRDAIRRDTKIYTSQFHYPRTGGYGTISDRIYEQVSDCVRLESRITALEIEEGRIVALRYENGGAEHSMECDRVVSTIPATRLGRILGHEFQLRFQPVTLVYLLVDRPQVMPYHWVYFADLDVAINRLAEFKNFSDLEAPPDQTVMIAEVTLQVDDPKERVISALEQFGFVTRSEILDTLTLFEEFGYPVYDRNFEKARDESAEVFGAIENLHLVGRNSEFRHNEVDENFASAMQLVELLKSSRDSVPETFAAAGAQ